LRADDVPLVAVRGAPLAVRGLASPRAAGGSGSAAEALPAAAFWLRAAARLAVERWGRVCGRLASTPSDASDPLGRPLLSLAALTGTSLLNTGSASAATIRRIAARTR
jgi:hypothetical protein